MSDHHKDHSSVFARRRAYFKRVWIWTPAAYPSFAACALGTMCVAGIWYHHLVRNNAVIVNPNHHRQWFEKSSPTLNDPVKTQEKYHASVIGDVMHKNSSFYRQDERRIDV